MIRAEMIDEQTADHDAAFQADGSIGRRIRTNLVRPPPTAGITWPWSVPSR